MKKFVYLFSIIFLLFSCSKPDSPTKPILPEPDTTNIPKDTFLKYIIPSGKNYCLNNTYTVFTQSFLKFIAVFDSSCIYTTANPQNQADINKLYGFADCGTFHQVNSARFGWNWQDGKMHIHAYCYADSVRQYKELGTVLLEKENLYQLEALHGMYIFTLNGKKDTMLRHCTDTVLGYKLLPYFGGDETAPHEVHIKIKELK